MICAIRSRRLHDAVGLVEPNDTAITKQWTMNLEKIHIRVAVDLDHTKT